MRDLVLGLVAAVVLAGCAGPLPIATRNDVDEISDNIASVRGQQTAQMSDIRALKLELRQIRGQIEELEFSLKNDLKRDLAAGLASVNGKRDLELQALASRLPPPDYIPQSFFSADLERVRSDTSGSLEEQLVAAFGALKKDQPQEALGVFEEVGSRKTPPTVLAIIQFWTAFLNAKLGNYATAVQGWHQFVTSFPKHTRAPYVLAQQLKSFEALGDKDGAKITKQKLLTSYPKSPEALRLKGS
jgi:TolA-binding protein